MFSVKITNLVNFTLNNNSVLPLNKWIRKMIIQTLYTLHWTKKISFHLQNSGHRKHASHQRDKYIYLSQVTEIKRLLLNVTIFHQMKTNKDYKWCAKRHKWSHIVAKIKATPCLPFYSSLMGTERESLNNI